MLCNYFRQNQIHVCFWQLAQPHDTCLPFPNHLCNDAQNCDGVRLVTEGVKIGPLEVAAEKGRSKVLQNMMHGLVGSEGTESLSHIVGDFVDNCSENVDRQDGSDLSGLKENVLHCLSIFCNTRVGKRSRGREINGPSNQKS